MARWAASPSSCGWRKARPRRRPTARSTCGRAKGGCIISTPKPASGSEMNAWPYPRWVAHRGAGKLAPENTLASFRLGAQYGYRMFECDAKLSADGVPFLMHDATLDRTTNARAVFGPAPSNIGGDHAWAELAKLDAGGWHSRSYAGE